MGLFHSCCSSGTGCFGGNLEVYGLCEVFLLGLGQFPQREILSPVKEAHVLELGGNERGSSVWSSREILSFCVHTSVLIPSFYWALHLPWGVQEHVPASVKSRYQSSFQGKGKSSGLAKTGQLSHVFVFSPINVVDISHLTASLSFFFNMGFPPFLCLYKCFSYYLNIKLFKAKTNTL